MSDPRSKGKRGRRLAIRRVPGDQLLRRHAFLLDSEVALFKKIGGGNMAKGIRKAAALIATLDPRS